jgi:hypothetical protein
MGLMRTRFVMVVLALGLAAASCGGGGGAGVGPVAAADFPMRFASDWCGLLARCCVASGGAATSTCATDTEARIAQIATEATSQGATFDSAAAGKCLSGLSALTCEATDPVALLAALDACNNPWVGVVPPGGACMTYASCAKPPASAGTRVGASCVNGICVQAVAVGVGAACSTTMTTMVCDARVGACQAGVCTALPGSGEACTGSCKPGLRCTAGTCAARAAMGATCTADSDCASDICSGGKCASAFAGDECTLP